MEIESLQSVKLEFKITGFDKFLSFFGLVTLKSVYAGHRDTEIQLNVNLARQNRLLELTVDSHNKAAELYKGARHCILETAAYIKHHPKIHPAIKSAYRRRVKKVIAEQKLGKKRSSKSVK